MTADSLAVVREPVDWMLSYGHLGRSDTIAQQLYGGVWSCGDLAWTTPDWLLDHQRISAIRVAGTLRLFRGAILADAVGLGKTYVALAAATRYRSVVAVVPAALRSQWLAAAARVGARIAVVSHESLSRGGKVPPGDLVVVDEAHWYRNPATRRYDSLARGIAVAHLLLVTATPVVNGPGDLVHLLRLFLPDNGLRPAGLASIAGADLKALANAAAAVTISGSDRMAPVFLPGVRDLCVRCATLSHDHHGQVLELIEKLQFPNFGGVGARQLLRTHMLLRLASSSEALLATVRGHLRYLRTVRTGNHSGRSNRSAIRAICGDRDEAQLDFLAQLAPYSGRLHDLSVLQREEELLERVVRLVRADAPDPKGEKLRELIGSDPDRTTLVFTGAAVTARALARRLDWRRTAVATGRGSRISSGPVAIDEVLDSFSPRSRGVSDPAASFRITTMVATDLASEGLNLQDADSLVHYDLAWNPMKLQQRLGRIRRIGSPYRNVSVTWFLPSAHLEKALQLPTLIDRKSRQQIRLGVSTTAVAGRSLQYNRIQEQRQLLCGRGRPADSIAGHLVVRGTGAVVCLRWHLGPHLMFETVAVTPHGVTADPFVIGTTIEALVASAAVSEPVPDPVRRLILGHVRRRIRLLQRTPPVHPELRRRVLARARRAARDRDTALLNQLDRVLDALQVGVASGIERAISDWLDGRGDCPENQLDKRFEAPPDFRNVAISAAIFGNEIE